MMTSDLQVLLLQCAGIRCALRRSEVSELLALPRLSRPPAMPRAIAGFFDLGGKAVPVLSLAALFDLPESSADPSADLYRHLVLVPGPAGPMALLVERVLDLAVVTGDSLCPVRDTASLNGCVEAEIRLGETLVPLLALERILLAEEKLSLADLVRKAQTRLGEWAAAS